MPRPLSAVIKKLDHVAIVVRDMQEALGFYRDLLGLRCSEVKELHGQGGFRTLLVFVDLGNAELELVQPLQEGDTMGRFLQERGEGLHHVCFEIDSLPGTAAELQSKGVKLRYNGQHRSGKLDFLYPQECKGVLVEVLEKPGPVH
ncbi:MAG: VOC family protein [Chloroflexi bacterium]|nr:VOC family protein [Chloroflexota bacterium]